MFSEQKGFLLAKYADWCYGRNFYQNLPLCQDISRSIFACIFELLEKSLPPQPKFQMLSRRWSWNGSEFPLIWRMVVFF